MLSLWLPGWLVIVISLAGEGTSSFYSDFLRSIFFALTCACGKLVAYLCSNNGLCFRYMTLIFYNLSVKIRMQFFFPVNNMGAESICAIDLPFTMY